MKKLSLIILVLLFLVACGDQKLNYEIPNEKFDVNSEIPSFDTLEYITLLKPILDDIDYVRLDSVLLDGYQSSVVVTDAIVENIISIYNHYEKDRTTYELVNFLDLHIKKLSKIDLDIILFKIIEYIEHEYTGLKVIVDDAQFDYLMVDYISKITDTFLDNYEINGQVLTDYPDMVEYLERIKRLVNGGYQIIRFEDEYYLFPDYADILVRYKDYYSEETRNAVNILVRESRNLVLINDIIQMDNEAIAYKVNELESFMKLYPNSVYFPMMLDYYITYMNTIITNPDNISEVAVSTYHYKEVTIQDFNRIINRYSEAQMARFLKELTEKIQENDMVYDENILLDLKNKIRSSY